VRVKTILDRGDIVQCVNVDPSARWRKWGTTGAGRERECSECDCARVIEDEGLKNIVSTSMGDEDVPGMLHRHPRCGTTLHNGDTCTVYEAVVSKAA
jgi:hypothetical protein